jgi:hypothetical protein
MKHVSEITKENIYSRIKADLCPSRPVVHAKIGFSVALGGLISLFLCGQLGFGLSSLALMVHHQIMEVAGFLGCTVVCGVLFALVPAITLRVITSSIQFKVLIRHEWKALSGWILLFGGIIAYMNNDADPIWTLFVWGIAAIGSFELFSNALHKAMILWRRTTA